MYKKMYMYRMCLFISDFKKIEIMLHKSPMFKMKPGKKLRVMIHYHINIQLFITLSMWQGGPPP
jgi:hypothetical protein